MALETKKEGNIITELASSVRLPKMVKVKQLLDHSHIDVNEIPGIVRSELDREELRARIKPGASVAITCGSRGVANIAVIIRAIVDFVKECGGSPFIFPAMGSHGGATAQGQREILASYHIALAALAGGISVGHVNDSGFWVVSNLSGFTVTGGLKTYTVAQIIMSISIMILTLLFALILPGAIG